MLGAVAVCSATGHVRRHQKARDLGSRGLATVRRVGQVTE